MNRYIDKLEQLKSLPPIISVCGDDCAVCPRYLAKTEEELHETAVFWHKAGWRDSIVSNEEIKCTGCGSRPTCSFDLLPCTKEHGVNKCRECGHFQCERVKACIEGSKEKMQQCRQACASEEEFQMLVRAFYEKEKNLNVDTEVTVMKLIKAEEKDFPALSVFYRYVIQNTKDMEIYAKWVYGQHPTDEMIKEYMTEGAMYYCERDGEMIAAFALTPYQCKDYHDTDWQIAAADDEVSVVHILCVDPKLRKQGIAREAMRLVIGQSRIMGKKAVRLDALACNTPAHRLYESLRFQKRGQQLWYADNVGRTEFYLFEFVL